MKKFNKKFIILFAILIFVILCLSALFIPNVIIKKSKDSNEQLTESSAKSKVESALALAFADKSSASGYNSTTYLTTFLQNQGLVVNDDVVSLGDWNFSIDRNNLSILQSLGATEVTFKNELLTYFPSTTYNGSYIITVNVTATSTIPIDTIVFENIDGTLTTDSVNSTSYSKNIDVLVDKEFLVTAITKDGKTNLDSFVKNLNLNFDSFAYFFQTPYITKSDYYPFSANSVSYNTHYYYYEGDLTLDGTTAVDGATLSNSIYSFGNTSKDLATASANANYNILLKVNGNLTINSGVTLTTCSNAYGGPKGLFLYCTGTLTNNGIISMTAKGAKATGQNVYLYKGQSGTYEYVPSSGASGGTRVYSNNYTNPTVGTSGTNGSARRLGGGGAGAACYLAYSGAGANGTSYSGGTGGGGGFYNYNGNPGTANGGAGGAGLTGTHQGFTSGSGGGAGNPGGTSAASVINANTAAGSNGTGGLLVIYTDSLDNTNGTIESNGSSGGPGYRSGGGGSGGGSVNVFYLTSLIKGTITANGGAGGAGTRFDGLETAAGGNGGNGCVSTGCIATGSYVAK